LDSLLSINCSDDLIVTTQSIQGSTETTTPLSLAVIVIVRYVAVFCKRHDASLSAALGAECGGPTESLELIRIEVWTSVGVASALKL